MKQNRSSLTASGIAIVRAIESEKPAGERVCYDPYARRFVNGGLFHLIRFFDKIGYSERAGAGVMGFLAVRERHIDEHLQACLNEGLQQLVILGAGFDARAYRFDQLKQGKRVFEVDHPATQAVKLDKVREIFGRVPEHVTFVPVDFNTQTLAQRLIESGYDESLKTLFIWQGVTQYLTPEAVDSTLAFVAGHSAPGSSIIFDYVYPATLEDPAKHGEVKRMRRMRRVSGEGLVFGIPAGTVKTFLQQRGFAQVHNADSHLSSRHLLHRRQPQPARGGRVCYRNGLCRGQDELDDGSSPTSGNRSLMDIETALKTFRSPDLSNYPELAGYTREQIYDETIGGGALYLAARMVRTMDLHPGQLVLDLGCGHGATSMFLARHSTCGSLPSIFGRRRPIWRNASRRVVFWTASCPSTWTPPIRCPLPSGTSTPFSA